MANPAFQVCFCGHILFHHFDGELCFFSSGFQRPLEVICDCKGFKADNLKMLEDIVNEKAS